MGVRRFTLVELMIVVAIIAVLAAVALPMFNAMQLSAKRAEAPVNWDGLQAASIAYGMDSALTTGSIILPTNPSSNAGKTLRPFLTTGAYAGWTQTLGWAPDGEVRCVYIWAVSAFGFPVIS